MSFNISMWSLWTAAKCSLIYVHTPLNKNLWKIKYGDHSLNNNEVCSTMYEQLLLHYFHLWKLDITYFFCYVTLSVFYNKHHCIICYETEHEIAYGQESEHDFLIPSFLGKQKTSIYLAELWHLIKKNQFQGLR